MVRLIEKESRMVNVRNWERRRGNCWWMGTELKFCQMKKVLEFGCTKFEGIWHGWTGNLKMAIMVNFMLWVFYCACTHTHTHTQTLSGHPPEGNHRGVRADNNTAHALHPPSSISTPTTQAYGLSSVLRTPRFGSWRCLSSSPAWLNLSLPDWPSAPGSAPRIQ